MIYIIKHKDYDNPIPKDYMEIGVGEYFIDEGDNINELNPYINEATGIYDVWKQFNDDIVGICHYRRYFYSDGILTLETAKNILKTYDIIVTKKVIFDKGIYEQLRSEIENPDILDKYYNILIEKEPQLEQWFKLKSFNAKEMFVCNRKLLDKYCKWLFPLIIPIARQFIEEDSKDAWNKRMVGHLVERLFAYWIWKNKLNYYEMEYIDI